MLSNILFYSSVAAIFVIFGYIIFPKHKNKH